MSNAKDVFAELVERAATDLFAEYGCEISVLDRHAPQQLVAGHGIAGIIGYAADEMRGSLCMRLPAAMARCTHPQKETLQSDAQLDDWVGELCNQLLGRAKNRLLAYGVTLGLGTPVIASSEAALRIASGSESIITSFESEAGILSIAVDVRAVDGLELHELPADAALQTQEGDFLLF